MLFLDFLRRRGYSVTKIDSYGLLYEVKNKSFLRFLSAIDFNRAECSKILKDKVFTYISLKRLGVKIPRGTYFVLGDSEYSCSPQEVVENLEAANYPIIIKPNDSSLGKGITILREFNRKRIDTAISRAQGYSRVIIAQEYLSGVEYRVVAVENEIIFILKKFKNPKHPVEIPISSEPKFSNIVKTCMKHFGATVCGFDFIVNKGSIKVLEINSNPFILQIKEYLSEKTFDRYFSCLEQLLRRNYG